MGVCLTSTFAAGGEIYYDAQETLSDFGTNSTSQTRTRPDMLPGAMPRKPCASVPVSLQSVSLQSVSHFILRGLLQEMQMSLAQVSQFPTSWYVLPSQSLLPGPLHSSTTSNAAYLLHHLFRQLF